MEFLITQVPMGVIPPYIIDSLTATARAKEYYLECSYSGLDLPPEQWRSQGEGTEGMCLPQDVIICSL